MIRTGTGGSGRPVAHTLLTMRAPLTKFLTVTLIGIVLALAVLVSDRYLPGLPQQPEQLPPAVVTVGDSTLSGEGAGNYEPGTDGENGNWCHRSPSAAVHQMPLPPDVTPINIACSGSKSASVGSPDQPGPQARQLAEVARHYRITAVIVQLGANDDPGFTDVVNRCVGAWSSRTPDGCAGEMRKAWPQRVERMKPKALSALRELRGVLDREGYTPASYSLVLQSYAAPVGPGVAPELRNLSGCPFQPGDLGWIRDKAVPQLSQALHDVAQQADARFLDLSRAGQGHGACSGGAQSPESEWFTRLTVDWRSLADDQRAQHAMQESFHPNAAGHAQFGRCVGRFLAGDSDHAACLPDELGDLRPVRTPEATQVAHP